VNAPESRPEASGKAIAALVLGILGLLQLAPCIGPIGAIAFGWGETTGVGRAGLILGWITLALYALTAMILLMLLVLGGAAALPFMN